MARVPRARYAEELCHVPTAEPGCAEGSRPSAPRRVPVVRRVDRHGRLRLWLSSPSPPPADVHTDHVQHASMSDLFLELRRRADADGHSLHRQQQQQQQVQVITPDPRQLIASVGEADRTTTKKVVFIFNKPRYRDAASPRHHHHQANTAATPYHRPERHSGWSNRRRRRSPAQHEDDDEGATQVVCLANMLSPGDRLEDDGFYQDFLEDVTEEARKFGHLVKVVIPRPCPSIQGGGAASLVAGVGKVFLEYTHLDDAAYYCRWRLEGRSYSGKEITATFFSHDRFAAGDYNYSG